MILGWFADFELRDRLGYDLTPVALQGSQRLAAMGFRTARNARRRLGGARPSAA